MIGPNRSAGAGRDALPRVRRCTSRRFFLLLLRTRSCAIGAEALAHQLNEVVAFLGRAMSDRAGARPYQVNVRRRIAGAHPMSANLLYLALPGNRKGRGQGRVRIRLRKKTRLSHGRSITVS